MDKITLEFTKDEVETLISGLLYLQNNLGSGTVDLEDQIFALVRRLQEPQVS